MLSLITCGTENSYYELVTVQKSLHLDDDSHQFKDPKYIKTFLRAFNPMVGINTTSDLLESTRGHFHLALYLE